MTELETWTRVRVADGVLLAHPLGEQRGVIRIRRRTHVRTLHAVLAETIARSPRQLAAASCVEVRRLVTNEGEHAAVVVLRNTFPDGERLDRRIAVVVGDDAAIQLEGFSRASGDAGFAREFEALVARVVTGAAPERRRMFVYQPPPGWQGLRRSLSTLWLAPGAPRATASIEVHDAIPLRDPRAERAHALLRGPGDPAGAPITIGELTGTLGAAGAVLSDRRFRYEIELDDPAGAHAAVLDALVRSIEPIPRALPAAAGAATALDDDFGWVL